MATGTLWFTPIQLATDANNAVLNGAKAYFYLAGTSTAATVYQDVTLVTPHASPVVANSSGRFAEIYLTPGTSYKVDVQTSAGVSISGYPADNQAAIPAVSGSTDITGTAGVAITAGQVVYLSDGSGSLNAGQWYLGDADFTYASTLPLIGIAPAAIASGTASTIRLAGQVTGLSGLTAGTNYYVSATAGALTSTAPSNARFVGVADSTSSIVMIPNPTSSTAGFDIVQIEALLG